MEKQRIFYSGINGNTKIIPKPLNTPKQLFYPTILKNVEPYIGECFIHVIFYDGTILPYYYISNMGRLYSVRYERLITPYLDEGGYYRVTISLPDGKTSFTGIHKLMLMSFFPITEPDRFIPNHKDGIKTHNFIHNLEWATISANTRHALDNNLCHYVGTDSPRSYLTDEQVEFICECIKDGKEPPLIATLLGYGTENQAKRNKICAIIRNIKYGSAYMSISNKYGIPGMEGDYRFPEEMAYDICNIMSQPGSENYDYDDLARILNIDENRRRYFKSFVIDIFKKAGYSHARATYPNAKRPKPIKIGHKNYKLYF